MGGNYGRRQHHQNGDGGYQRTELAGGLAEHILGLALEKRKLAADHIKHVYDTVPQQYHKHIRLLSQKEKLWDKEFFLTDEQRKRGLQSYNGKTFVETYRPYVDVEGRITEMIDVHNEQGRGYKLDTYADQIGNFWVIECVFEGLNRRGQEVKTRDRAVIGFGGTGVDATNPIENATTSAVGRALAQAGYGCIGSGLTSFEDIFIGLSRQKALEELNAANRQSGERSSGRNDGGNSRGASGGTQPGQPQNRNEQDDPANAKNLLVRNLIDLTKGFDQVYLKNRVSQLLKITFNGKFNSLDVGQLRLVEAHLKAELENNQRVS
ncbi:hypothetical protein [Paenibacillus rubinfantis]|uniref:hypothetical protein n=1 Tax=Paenibacillus rubinfantis TaxID=1720296 RepID=UPI00073EA903|nr:hypothetical protein [Paenibacillus rubinfantis]